MTACEGPYKLDTVALYDLIQKERAELAEIESTDPKEPFELAQANSYLIAALPGMLDRIEEDIKAGADSPAIMAGILSVLSSTLALIGDGFGGSYEHRTRALSLVAGFAHRDAQDGLTKRDLSTPAAPGSRAVQ